MTAEPAQVEKEAIARAADDLVRQGYDVIREPGRNDLPEFLHGFRPDLVAHRGAEHLVVEVKGGSWGQDPSSWRDLAAEVRRHPGWQLRLVLAAPPSGRAANVPPPPSPSAIRKKLRSARRLYESNEQAAALLLLWSLLEAAAHHRLKELGVSRDGPKTPIALLKDLVSFGLLEPEEYDQLVPGVTLRNALAHGRSTMPVARDIFDKLAVLVERLTAREPRSKMSA